MLEKINNINDLKKLNIKEKSILAEDIRKYMLNVISNTGGHIASNLGVVELTLALHSEFDVPKDKIIWDVGHQTYVHKILTGRKEEFKKIRSFNGIAGFPKVSESEADCFNTGHSSTSISAALGMAKARDIKRKNNKVIAVIGDGALTGGMALEALNDAGNRKTNLIVILNDNEMSISKNVGGINLILSRLRSKKLYNKSNFVVKKFIYKIPKIGNKIVKFVQKSKRSIKQFFIPKMYFEDIGFKYLGPVDGHDLEKMEGLFKLAKGLDGPILIHVLTKKGKGFKPAEENPDKFHAIGPFDLETGDLKKRKSKDYSKVFGEKLTLMAEKNQNIVAVTAAMKDGTGLSKFQKMFPDRFFDVGIAEQHAVTFAAGLAKEGIIPFVPIYSSFYQRCYDQVIHDVCMQNLPVVFCVDRAGIVGADGETHQGVLDMSFFKLVPNLSIICPKDFEELEQMMEFVVKLKKPVVIRYPRGGEGKIKFKKHDRIKYGKSEFLKQGKNLTIIGIGKTVHKALEVAKELEKKNIKAEVINARFIKPLDKENIKKSILKTKNVITIEDSNLIGGLGCSVKELIIDENIKNVRIKCFGYPDEYIKHGSVQELEEYYKLDTKNIIKFIEKNKFYNKEKVLTKELMFDKI